MSRRRAEFEHRTSIFEGAYRAWSGLGGLEPEDLETKSVKELNPVTHPLKNDNRCITGKPIKKQAKGGKKERGGSDPENSNSDDGVHQVPGRKVYPYEALPRSGLAHPFVQAILSPWLGADADKDAIEVGLTTLRTWWQHRRRGESGSAITALGTDRMQGIVERYMHHFFNLAHSLITVDNEQPPRTLMVKMNELAKARKKKTKKRNREGNVNKIRAMGLNAGITQELGIVPTIAAYSSIPNTSNMHMKTNPAMNDPMMSMGSKITLGKRDFEFEPTPIETIYATAQHERSNINGTSSINNATKYDIYTNPSSAVQATQSMLSGESKASSCCKPDDHPKANAYPTETPSSNCCSIDRYEPDPQPKQQAPPLQPEVTNNVYGDPKKTPVVLVSENGDIQIAMSIDGITCASCVKIVETVLRGCQGNKSPINGLLDAVADMKLRRVLIKINQSSNAKRIAFEASRNLSMVGYTANVKEMSTLYGSPRAERTMSKVDLDLLSEAFLAVGSTHSSEIFDWNLPCSCPDNGVVRGDCARHSQMNTKIFEAFDLREKKVNKYMAGCGQRYGGRCTCGMDCECADCPVHPRTEKKTSSSLYQRVAPQPKPQKSGGCCGGGGGNGEGKRRLSLTETRFKRETYGRQSTTSGFGRALSALSALSLDWENMEDFDVNVDHSAHINNSDIPSRHPQKVSEKEAELIYEGCAMMYGGICNCGPTCVCVGCPIHDKDNARESSPAVTTDIPYHFSRSKKRNLRSSILYRKKDYSDQAPPNHGVTFQV